MAKKRNFKKEYYLQKITNAYLKELFDLKLFTFEFQLGRKRLDGLAYDEKTKSFVIIEYKNKIDFEVLKQAKSYYELLQNNRDKYVEKYNEKFDSNLKEKDFDFDKTKVMIISPKFSKDQIDKSKNPDFPFELYLATLFECDDKKYYILYEGINVNFNKKLDIDPDELKITEEMLLEDKSPEMIELYNNLRDNVLGEFDDVEIRYMVNQFSFRVNDKLLCVVIFLKSSFNIHIYADQLNNAEKTVDISEKSTGGNAKYQFNYKSDDDFDYFMDLFKQTYDQKK